MASEKSLKPVSAQPGKPLYMVVRDAVREAIDAGVFLPGEQMPSTKELSEQMAVSLVTWMVDGMPASVAARSKAFAAECRLPEP